MTFHKDAEKQPEGGDIIDISDQRKVFWPLVFWVMTLSFTSQDFFFDRGIHCSERGVLMTS